MRAVFAFLAMTAPAYAGVDVFDCEMEPRFLGATYEVVRCQASNSSSRSVASFHYKWVASEDGREVPWSVSDRPHLMRVDGGIEPGETISISFYPRLLSDRANPDRVEYKITVVAAFDVDGEPIDPPAP